MPQTGQLQYSTSFQFTTMSSPYPIIQSRLAVPHIITSCSTCHTNLEFAPPSPAPRSGTMLSVQCCSCKSSFSHTFYPAQVLGTSVHPATDPSRVSASASSSGAQSGRKGRKIGTQERPLETGYYDILGVPVNATTDDVKKAYRAFSSCCSSYMILPE